MNKRNENKKEHIDEVEHDGHVDYHIYHESDDDPSSKQVNLAGYAIIKYIALIIIVIAILYFIAVYILPFVRELTG